MGGCVSIGVSVTTRCEEARFGGGHTPKKVRENTRPKSEWAQKRGRVKGRQGRKKL